MKTFSDRLKFAMAEAGLNQSALSEKTGASKALSASTFPARTPPALTG